MAFGCCSWFFLYVFFLGNFDTHYPSQKLLSITRIKDDDDRRLDGQLGRWPHVDGESVLATVALSVLSAFIGIVIILIIDIIITVVVIIVTLTIISTNSATSWFQCVYVSGLRFTLSHVTPLHSWWDSLLGWPSKNYSFLCSTKKEIENENIVKLFALQFQVVHYCNWRTGSRVGL